MSTDHKIIGPEHKYRCYSRPQLQPAPIQAQDGWTADGRRNVITIMTKWTNVECGFTDRDIDTACRGCRWSDDVKNDEEL